MPDFCSAYGCSRERNAETHKQGITFHKFPKDKRRRQAWVSALRRRNFVPKNWSVLCSCHFNPEDFDRTGQSTRLREGVIPSVFNFPDHIRKQVPSAPRLSRTSQQAAAECPQARSRSPVKGPGELKLTQKLSSDHQYAFDPVKAKQKLYQAQEKMEELQRNIRNARDRERRHKKAMKFLLDELKNNKLLTQDLQQKIDLSSS
ncbi:hypothetical protein DNTS_032066 [Danionella cerebrum]|uniref:THAP-type domain-containing protein n=1 Tax=Danionella cerebrum TaxID=2873325 RepID=A0A553MWL2_9TELE|nr:hypothetical protein DNTS_032066 [Danionella translucida]